MWTDQEKRDLKELLSAIKVALPLIAVFFILLFGLAIYSAIRGM